MEYNRFKTSNQSYGNFSPYPIVQEFSDKFRNNYISPLTSSDTDHLPGLPNFGNTCYINSALQCLFHLQQISNFFHSEKFLYNLKKDRKQAKLARIFQQLLISSKENKENSLVSDLLLFKENFQALNENFEGFEQQDSQEFLRIFLENLHEAFNNQNTLGNIEKPKDFAIGNEECLLANKWWDFNQNKDFSIITQLFSGQYISTLNCSLCRNVSKCFDNFWDLSLSFKTNENKFTIDWLSKKDYELDRLFDEFLQREIVETKCDKCNKTSQKTKCLKFSRIPDILCIHLKRFEFCDGFRRKIKNSVVFPKKQLSLYPHYLNNNYNRDSCYFDLVGVIHHYGEVNYGHYVADCRKGGRWFRFDDSQVKDSEFNDGGNDIRSETAYVLFYEKTKKK